MAQWSFDVSDVHKVLDYGKVLLTISYPIQSDDLKKIKLAINAQLDHEISLIRNSQGVSDER